MKRNKILHFVLRILLLVLTAQILIILLSLPNIVRLLSQPGALRWILQDLPPTLLVYIFPDKNNGNEDVYQNEQLNKIKDLGAAVHPQYSFRQDDDKYLFIHINEKADLQEILFLVESLHTPPGEMVFQRISVDSEFVERVQNIGVKKLRFWQCRIAKQLSSSEKPLIELPSLDSLEISGCHTAWDFIQMFSKNQLRRIGLLNCKIGFPEINAIKQFNKLEILTLVSVDIDDDTIRAISTIFSVEEINFKHVIFQGDGLNSFLALSNLKQMSFVYCNLQKVDFSWMKSCKNIITIEISESKMNKEQFDILQQLNNERKIHLIGIPVIIQ